MADAPQVLTVDLSLEAPPPDGFVDRIRADALALVEAGEFEKAQSVLAEASRLEALGPREELRPMNADELAQRDADQQSAADQLQLQRKQAAGALRANRDRWLAQTDALFLPDAALPTDMPQALKDAVSANRPAWKAFRQALRDYPATVTDPLAPPDFPQPPQSPALILS
jgi:hypothetical protein